MIFLFKPGGDQKNYTRLSGSEQGYEQFWTIFLEGIINVIKLYIFEQNIALFSASFSAISYPKYHFSNSIFQFAIDILYLGFNPSKLCHCEIRMPMVHTQ
jgi:hypothetical protein